MRESETENLFETNHRHLVGPGHTPWKTEESRDDPNQTHKTTTHRHDTIRCEQDSKEYPTKRRFHNPREGTGHQWINSFWNVYYCLINCKNLKGRWLDPILPYLDYITLAHNNHVSLFTIMFSWISSVSEARPINKRWHSYLTKPTHYSDRPCGQ